MFSQNFKNYINADDATIKIFAKQNKQKKSFQD